MTDRLTTARRSANMAAIRGRDTAPELAVRRALRLLGIGYRLHDGRLPGRPDIVMRGRRTVIFVHGCFWHRHEGCHFAYSPKSKREFWQTKFAGNVARARNQKKLLDVDGWSCCLGYRELPRTQTRLHSPLERWNLSLEHGLTMKSHE